MINKIANLTLVILFFCLFTNCSKETRTITDVEIPTAEIDPELGYKVWLGTTCSPKNAVIKPSTWANTAKLIEGLNVNNTPVLPAAGTPSEGEESLTTGEFNQFVNIFEKGSKNGFFPFPRTFFKNDAFPTRDDLIPFLEKKFKGFDSAGYFINGIMFFDNFVGSSSNNGGVVYSWTQNEVQEMRDWLDANHPNVKLYWNARNFSIANKNWCESTLVDDVVIEAKPELWYANAGSRQDLLKWLWLNEKTINKRIIFQVPINTMTDPYDFPNGFQQMREWVRWLGADLMDFDFMRSERVIIMPVTYNPTFTFYPETTNNGSVYANTMTGIALSLIEQKNIFQGIEKVPSKEDAYNQGRTY